MAYVCTRNSGSGPQRDCLGTRASCVETDSALCVCTCLHYFHWRVAATSPGTCTADSEQSQARPSPRNGSGSSLRLCGAQPFRVAAPVPAFEYL